MKRVQYHLTEDQIGRLKAVCEETGLSFAEVIRRAIDAYLEERDKKEKRKR
jgi:predicted DNA-binding protein